MNLVLYCMLVLLRCRLVTPLSPPIPPTDVAVSSSAQLAQALQNSSIGFIYLSPQSKGEGVLTLQAEDFTVPALVASGRNVTIASGNPDDLTVLDFNGVMAALILGAGSSLTLENLALRGYANPDSVNASTWPYYQNFAFSAWPSVVVYPNVRFTYVNSTQFFFPETCSIRADVFRNGLVYGQQNVFALSDRAIFFRQGTGLQPVYNITTKAIVGQFTVSFTNLTGVCVPQGAPAPAAPPGSSPSSARTGALVGGILGGIFVAVAVLGAALFLVARKRRASAQSLSQETGSSAPADERAVGLPPTPRSPESPNPLRRGSSPRSDGLQSTFSQYVGSPLGAAAHPELWLLRKFGPLADEQVEIGPLIGQGGYGRVYKGRWQGAMVAIKVVTQDRIHQDTSTDTLMRAFQESILSTSLAHPNVVATYKICSLHGFDRPSGPSGDSLASGPNSAAASGTSSGVASGSASGSVEARHPVETLFIMEYCDRGSLLDAIDRGRFHGSSGPPKPDLISIVRCLIDISTGMQYLHSVGVLHGDLKPGNVLLRSTGTDARGFICKLADFGVSRILNLDEQTHVVTQTHGTACFMPPEILKSGHMSAAADVYSFAMVMYQLYSRKVPFPGMAVGQVFWAVAVNNERPDIPADCPEDYAQLMTSCWDADPAARPTFAELRQVLMNMFQRLRVASPSPSRSSEVSSKKEASTGGSQDAPTADPDIPGGRDEAVLAVVPDL